MNTNPIEMFLIMVLIFVIYVTIPQIIYKIKGPAEGRNEGEELTLITMKIFFFISGIFLIGLIIKLLRGILT